MASQRKLPKWAIIPAAGKLVVESLRHPNSAKVVSVDTVERKVNVQSYKDSPMVGHRVEGPKP